VTGLPDIACSIEIAAPIERVWTCLTDEGLVEHWLGCLGFRPVVGAVFYMQPDAAKRAAGDPDGATHCEVEALERPHRLAFSWYMPGTPKTHVEIVLSAEAAGVTTARLAHRGWDRFGADDVAAIHRMLDGGWRSYVLPGLKRVAEG
jgi:uncharacterized protein YndB with AHSA1/START domain